MGELFGTIVEFIYKGYIQLMALSAPVRMALIILLLIIAIPTVIIIAGWLLRKAVKGLLSLIKYLEKSLGTMSLNRRTQGKSPIPGAGLLDGLFSVLLILLTKANNFLFRIDLFSPNTKEWYKKIGIAAIFIFPLWGVFSPDGKVANVWTDFEKKLISEHLEPLGFDPAAYKGFEHTNVKIKKVFGSRDGKDESSTGIYYVTPNDQAKKGAYIRESPSLNGKEITVLPYGEIAVFANEQQTDDDGRTWYKIQTEDNVVGWISSNVVNIYEEDN